MTEPTKRKMQNKKKQRQGYEEENKLPLVSENKVKGKKT